MPDGGATLEPEACEELHKLECLTPLATRDRESFGHLVDTGGNPHMISAEVQRVLKECDTDGDGQFSIDEVESIISTLLTTKKQAKSMQYVAMAAFVALLAVCASTFAMSLLGAEVAKDVSQSDDGLMTVKGSDQVVKVASSDMVVGPGGSLMMRTSLQDQADTPIRTAAYLTEHVLSSTVPDKYLAELKSFMYTSPLDGTAMSVHVDSFVRIPEYGAHCGSVVVLQTSLGNFTLDDEALYHSEYDSWVEVAGSFDVSDRRRMEDTKEGRRRLGASEAAALFALMEDGNFECTRMWMDEEYKVEPSSPKTPYAYVAHVIESCWEADEAGGIDLGEDENEDRPANPGNARRCISTYGPNSGKFKPGVTADGTAMMHMQYVLATAERMITVSRYPNHPLQVYVEVEDFTDPSGNMTKMSFQLTDSKPDQRRYCYQESVKDPGNVTIEDSFLSFLGMRGGLRHWSISPVDLETGEQAAKLADYFDYATSGNQTGNQTGNQPHSLHVNRNELDFNEVRYVSFEEELNATEVGDWLRSQFGGSVGLVDTAVGCTVDDMVMGVPAILGAFEEEKNFVDYYTSAMLEIDIDGAYVELLDDTTLNQYWGAVAYLRRLLAQQTAELGGVQEADEGATEEEVREPPVESHDLAIDITDPFFWREVGTAFLDENSTTADVAALWRSLFIMSPKTAHGVNMAGFITKVSQASGLSEAQLNDMPAQVTYETKTTLADLDITPDWLAGTHMSWTSGTKDYVIDEDQYVRFMESSAGDCSNAVYKVVDLPDDAYPDQFTVVVTTSQHAPEDPNVADPPIEVGVSVATLGLDVSTTVFFFADYDTAATASCDPGLESPFSAGRRQLAEVSDGEDVELWKGSDRSKPEVITRVTKGGGRRRRRRSPPPPPPSPPPFNPAGFAPTFSGATLKKPSSWIGANSEHGDLGGDIPHTPASWSMTMCPDSRSLYCAAGLSVTFDGESSPPWNKVSEALGCDLEIDLGVALMGGKWNNPKTSSYMATRTNGNVYKISSSTKCKRGLEESITVTVTKEAQPPKWAGSLAKNIVSKNTGVLEITHGHCVLAHDSHSLAQAKKDANFIRVMGSVSQSHELNVCKKVGVGGAHATLGIEGGIFGTVNVPYLRPRDTTGEIGGFLKGHLSLDLKVGDCKCKNNRITKRNRKVKCRSVAGGSGSLTLTATFMDIAFGDGSNGVDLKIYGKVTMAVKIMGVKINMPSASVTMQMNNIVDLDKIKL